MIIYIIHYFIDKKKNLVNLIKQKLLFNNHKLLNIKFINTKIFLLNYKLLIFIINKQNKF